MGEVIGGRYEVLEVLWTGGDTQVARGLDLRHDRTVCLKITRVAPGDDPAPLLEEGRLLLGLQPHPTMPTVRDDLLLDDRYVLVVDWIDGTSTAQLLAERGDPGCRSPPCSAGCPTSPRRSTISMPSGRAWCTATSARPTS